MNAIKLINTFAKQIKAVMDIDVSGVSVYQVSRDESGDGVEQHFTTFEWQTIEIGTGDWSSLEIEANHEDVNNPRKAWRIIKTALLLEAAREANEAEYKEAKQAAEAYLRPVVEYYSGEVNEIRDTYYAPTSPFSYEYAGTEEQRENITTQYSRSTNAWAEVSSFFLNRGLGSADGWIEAGRVSSDEMLRMAQEAYPDVEQRFVEGGDDSSTVTLFTDPSEDELIELTQEECEEMATTLEYMTDESNKVRFFLRLKSQLTTLFDIGAMKKDTNGVYHGANNEWKFRMEINDNSVWFSYLPVDGGNSITFPQTFPLVGFDTDAEQAQA
ncbi:hypothetical protein G3R49_19380 [Shewanella sp. WXL01]|uniref:hypothetical protein n=1 Tax=Shewanella sp. WXL01 TaxID=2709721 RepID=UPI00143829D0|nr:hypothetical protein [Shewanella sp. WXL01]NKF52722.1 hypothetical protein [Shewanella sp. WXL01]